MPDVQGGPASSPQPAPVPVGPSASEGAEDDSKDDGENGYVAIEVRNSMRDASKAAQFLRCVVCLAVCRCRMW